MARSYTGKAIVGLVKGARKVGGKVIRGARNIGGQVVKGLKYAGDKVVKGVKKLLGMKPSPPAGYGTFPTKNTEKVRELLTRGTGKGVVETLPKQTTTKVKGFSYLPPRNDPPLITSVPKSKTDPFYPFLDKPLKKASKGTKGTKVKLKKD